MEFAFITTSVLLVCFGLLGIFDSLYLHILKYRLYNHPESKTEHLTHTVRTILFLVILYYLYIRTDNISFYIGLGFVLLDILVLGMDAFLEHDSRRFMGGLPRWEYIIHLFVNGFHFAAIAVFLVIRVRVTGNQITVVNDFEGVGWYAAFLFIAKNFIPGSVVMALLHLLVAFPVGADMWDNFRGKLVKRTSYNR